MPRAVTPAPVHGCERAPQQMCIRPQLHGGIGCCEERGEHSGHCVKRDTLRFQSVSWCPDAFVIGNEIAGWIAHWVFRPFDYPVRGRFSMQATPGVKSVTACEDWPQSVPGLAQRLHSKHPSIATTYPDCADARDTSDGRRCRPQETE